MHDKPPSRIRSWKDKFVAAFRGLGAGVRGQSSFEVHFVFVAMVLVAAVLLRMSYLEWCVLLLCITTVLTAEMFNSALESMARAITSEWNPHLGNALDIASAAVLVAALGAATIGMLVFIHRIAILVQ